MSEKTDHNPNTNPEAISLIRQPDGNWKGWAQVHGTLTEVREIGPEVALQRLLTHE